MCPSYQESYSYHIEQDNWFDFFVSIDLLSFFSFRSWTEAQILWCEIDPMELALSIIYEVKFVSPLFLYALCIIKSWSIWICSTPRFGHLFLDLQSNSNCVI